MSPTDNAPPGVVQAVLDLLRGARAGLITDVDGTISPIVPLPEDARVLPRARQALLGLRDVLSLVAVISGRGAADARSMVGVDGLTYVGNHGLEVWTDAGPQTVPEARPWVARVASVLSEVEQRISEPGVVFENKGATASVHYRSAPDPAHARRELLHLLARSALTRGLRVEEGRMVLNLVPPLTLSKGSAVTWLVHQHRLRQIVYLGDDETDAHAFTALGALRQTGQARTLSIGVFGRETPLTVRQLADASVASPEAVADLLWQVLEGFQPSASMDGRAPISWR